MTHSERLKFNLSRAMPSYWGNLGIWERLVSSTRLWMGSGNGSYVRPLFWWSRRVGPGLSSWGDELGKHLLQSDLAYRTTSSGGRMRGDFVHGLLEIGIGSK
jgi:hypothetical protein